MLKAITALFLAAALIAGGWWWWNQRQSASDSPQYRTTPIVKTDIISSIAATGTVVPEDVVDVGTQVNGQIASFGKDTDGKPIDYRSVVTENTILARIDDTLYAADVVSGEAQLASAHAQVRVAEANVAQAIAKRDQAQRDWDRAQKLGTSRALSQADFDAAKSAFEQAQAAVVQTQAAVGQAQAQIQIAEASLTRSRRNLSLCTIISPVSGVIIDRKVDIGQTVVSSLNAPSLFLIAKDLSKMQVLVQVNEADIGNVKPGDEVNFTTDAFPGDAFTGVVRRVRLNATMTQNVVTYTVEISTDNSNLRLLPYLTANVRFIIAKRSSVAAVPNAALRWSPGGSAAPAASPTSNPAPRSATAAPATVPASTPAASPAAEPRDRSVRSTTRTSTIYVLRNGQPVPITVTPGLSDGTLTEVSSTELTDADQVITGELISNTSAAPAGTTNPFAPPTMGGGRRRG
jgi:HlyD family secretion protein